MTREEFIKLPHRVKQKYEQRFWIKDRQNAIREKIHKFEKKLNERNNTNRRPADDT